MDMVDQFQVEADHKTSRLLLEVKQDVLEVVNHLGI
jgi:hypothetical protein